ncbi:uncharacterized protein LOC111705006 [Eurytemora carolleeae]|uniref:uncharacterized protein LOC111705006 n=1 Tax=Eurytemora carolleeae TaxID=1294199 RepID=UPI000C77412B|nr:uncharacterized protein LOC111705006 [Eurytemora carolleeae]|eukprot:XP_023333200.1 uncharacterized protein LOC111705006 [Eurytemora affinis]
MNRMMKQEAHKLLDEISENDDVLQKLYLKRPFAEAAMARRASEYMLGRLGTSVPDSDVSEFFKSAKSSRRTSRASSRSKSARSRTEVSPKEGAKKLKEMLLSLIEKADFLVEDDLNALMEVLPDKDKLLLKVDSILSALGVNEEKDIEKIFNHLKISDTEEELAGLDADDTLSVAEKRSKILKIVRGYMEEPETTQRTEQNRQALFSGFNIMKKMTGAIKPDKEGYLWDELKESIEMFKTPDKTNLKHLLTKYKDLLLVRADLMGRNEKLKTQNNELKTLLKNVLPNQP